MNRFVVDCSVTMAWCFADEPDAYSLSALAALSEDVGVVPSIWPLEVANVLVVAERRGRLREAASHRFLALLGRLPIVIDEAIAAFPFWRDRWPSAGAAAGRSAPPPLGHRPRASRIDRAGSRANRARAA